MKKSLAILRFSEIKCKLPSFKEGIEWRTPTTNFDNGNWTVRIVFLESLKSDNSALAEISCLPEGEDLIHIKGNKISLFGGSQFKCDCQVIKTY